MWQDSIPFPSNVTVSFYSTPDVSASSLVRTVSISDVDDLLYSGAVLYFVVAYVDGRSLNKTTKQYNFVAYGRGEGGDASTGTATFVPTFDTALALIGVFLQLPCDAVCSAASYNARLLRHVLDALPYARTSTTACAACRVGSRLSQRCEQEVTVGLPRAAAALSWLDVRFPQMERAHSWLRTMSMCQWTRSTILPVHIQARRVLRVVVVAVSDACHSFVLQGFMETMVTIKRLLRVVGGVDAAVAAAPGVSDGTLSSAGYEREGPSLCSLVQLGLKNVANDMLIVPGASIGRSPRVASVIDSCGR